MEMSLCALRKAAAERVLTDPASTEAARNSARMLCECVAEAERDAEAWRLVLAEVEGCRNAVAGEVARTLAARARKQLGMENQG